MNLKQGGGWGERPSSSAEIFLGRCRNGEAGWPGPLKWFWKRAMQLDGLLFPSAGFNKCDNEHLMTTE